MPLDLLTAHFTPIPTQPQAVEPHRLPGASDEVPVTDVGHAGSKNALAFGFALFPSDGDMD